MQPFLYLAQSFNSTYSSNPDLYSSSSSVTNTSSGAGLFALGMVAFLVIMLPILIMLVITLAGQWKVYAKAKQPGWAAIVPIYNIYVLQKIVGRPGWWTVLYFVPAVGFVIGIINSLDLVKSFGKDAAYALLLILVPVVGYPLLGFGSAQYSGPSVAGANMAGPVGGMPPNPAQPSAPTPPPPPITSAPPIPQAPTPDDSPQPPAPTEQPPVQ